MNMLLFISLLLVQYYLCSGRENCPNCSNSQDCIEECAGGCSLPPPQMSWAHANWRRCKDYCKLLNAVGNLYCPVRQSGVCWCCLRAICNAETPPLPQDYYNNFDNNINIMENQIISLQTYTLIGCCLLFITIISISCITWNMMKKKKSLRYQKIVDDSEEEEEQEKLKV